MIVSLPLDQVSLLLPVPAERSVNLLFRYVHPPRAANLKVEPDSFVVSLPLPPEKQPSSSIPSPLSHFPSTDSTTHCEVDSLLDSQPQQLFTSVTEFHSMVITSMSLPDGWVDLTGGSEESVTLSKLQHYPGKPVQSTHTLVINSDFTWNVYVHGHLAQKSQCSLLSDLPERLHCNEDFKSLLTAVHASNVCIGNPDKRFDGLKTERKGVFKNASGERVVAYVDSKASVLDGFQSYSETIRHSFCELLANAPNVHLTAPLYGPWSAATQARSLPTKVQG